MAEIPQEFIEVARQSLANDMTVFGTSSGLRVFDRPYMIGEFWPWKLPEGCGMKVEVQRTGAETRTRRPMCPDSCVHLPERAKVCFGSSRYPGPREPAGIPAEVLAEEPLLSFLRSGWHPNRHGG